MSVRAEEHIPVLLSEVIESLQIKKDDVVIDGTVGNGGHANGICGLLGKEGIYIAIDLDRESLFRAKANIYRKSGNEIFFVEDNYKNIKSVLEKLAIGRKVNKILLDLGWNTSQMVSGRGFSFNKEEELLMTYGTSKENYLFTAKDIVNDWEEKNIADIIYNYADETNSRKIANAIVNYRKNKKIETSKELAEIVERTIPRHGKLHPATKTFQGLRIAVNDEIGSLKKGIAELWNVLDKNGRMAIISFHSTEDRIVKNFFKEKEDLKEGKTLIKATPSPEELKQNERSRSAKLRTIIKNI